MEIEFRTGKREVSDYIGEMLVGFGIKTHRLTFDQAIAEMNRRMEGNVINRAFDRLVDQHFAERGGRR